jgi:hypothetical protein
MPNRDRDMTDGVLRLLADELAERVAERLAPRVAELGLTVRRHIRARG